MANSPASNIPMNDHPRSIPEEIFMEWRRGNISESDWQTMSAAWVAQNTFKYPATEIPPMPDVVSGYVQGRISGKRERDDSIGARLGSWVQVSISSLDNNYRDHRLLLWALEKCQAAKLSDLAYTLEGALSRLTPYLMPPNSMEPALRVQAMDSRDRQAEVKRNGPK